MKDKTFYALASVFGEDGQTEDCMGLEKVLLAVIIDSKAKTHPAKIEPLRQNNRQGIHTSSTVNHYCLSFHSTLYIIVGQQY